MSKIIGVTVGTPTSPTKMKQELQLDFYSTTREELAEIIGIEGANPNDVICEVVWGLYDALKDQYPDRVRKNPIYNNDGTFTNYEYVISTGAYNTEGSITYYYGDEDVKKPKYLIMSGIHGWERPAILSTYRFIRDVVEGHNVPSQFREGCEIRVLPIGNPYSLDKLYETGTESDPVWLRYRPFRVNANQVDINRNFNIDSNLFYGWKAGEEDVPPFCTIFNGMPADIEKQKPATEQETQAIVNWFNNNLDAKAFFDCHNFGPDVNEIAWIMAPKEIEGHLEWKKTALRGIDRVIPFWRDSIGYGENTVYPVSMWTGGDKTGLAISYAAGVKNIPSLGLEMSFLQNSTQEAFRVDPVAITAESVACGAEVIGNVLLEFYEQYAMGEVMDMTETNGKLDTLAEDMNQTSGKVDAVADGVTKTGGKIDTLSESMRDGMDTIIGMLDTLLGGSDEPAEPVEPSNGFRVETGVYEVKGKDNEGTTVALLLPCTLNPKVIVIEPDRKEQITITKADGSTESKTTYEWILASEKEVFIGAVGQFLANYLPVEENKNSPAWPFYFGYMTKMINTGTTETPVWEPTQHFTMCRNNGTQMQIATPTQKVGKYHWKAYYWEEEQEQEPETEPEQE